MGLFDFVSGIGKKVFGDDDAEAGEKLKQHIESDNPGISGLSVNVENEVATLGGQADSRTAFEKAVLIAGNTLGINSVQANELVYPEEAPVAQTEAAAPGPTVEYYEIQKGDTLWAIATNFYGDGNKYQKIFEDNKEVIIDPDKIFPGQKIRIVK
ncbi:MAG: peptidoglycan-binding protein LysM [Pseudomonadota bacterium]